MLLQLGFDHDGDLHPGHALTGMGPRWFCYMALQEAKQHRADYDEMVENCTCP